MIVTFQGEIGAYSEEAALAFVPGADLRPLPSFEAVFEALVGATADLAVVPIENSLHGSVHTNYDLLREHDVRIVGEMQVRIRHHLMAVAGTTVESVREVHSHPQALGQCRDFLRTRLPRASVVPSYDTAGAAKMVAERAQPGVAAIASDRAAVEYGLEVIADGIESNRLNFTRFLALVRSDAPRALPAPARPGAGMKTSVLYVPHENIPGVLFRSLAVFALRDIDLFKIESRPLVGSPGQYIFYLDLAGSVDEEPVTKALDHLREIAAYVKVLGSYPRDHPAAGTAPEPD
jgi:prephenate dehydratase